jgi:hypothetical protein
MYQDELQLKLYPWEIPAYYELFLSDKSFISFYDGSKILEKRLLSNFEIKLIYKKIDSIKIPVRLKKEDICIDICPEIHSKLSIKSEKSSFTIKWSNSLEEVKPYSTIISLQNLLFDLMPLDNLPFEFPEYA